MQNKVLVIGSNGFVGFNLVKELIEHNYEVYCGISSHNSAYRVCTIKSKKVVLDITSEIENENLNEVDYIINCSTGPSEVIENGTKNILKACQKYKIKKYIHLSSVDVFGILDGEVDEDSIKNPTTPYGRSKLKSEEICFDFMKNIGQTLTIFRPAIIYGPDSELWVNRICRRVLTPGFSLTKKSAYSQCNLIYVSDLSKICIESLNNKNSDNKVYNLAYSEELSWYTYYNFLSENLIGTDLKTQNHFFIKNKLFLLDQIKSAALFLLKNFKQLILSVANSNSLVKNVFKQSQSVLTTNLNSNELDLVSRKVFYKSKNFNSDFNYKLNFDFKKGRKTSLAWFKEYFMFSKNHA